jgi:cellulose synthase (UDP-forming)
MIYASGTTYWEAFLPGLIVVLLSGTVLPWLDRDNRILRTCAIAVCLALSWRYMIWRLSYTLPPLGLTLDFSFGLLFLIVEVLAMISGTAALVFLTRATRSPRSSDRSRA